jgi:hypothetical protein
MATMKSNMPPATIKLEIVMPNMERICVPATAKTKSKPAAVTIEVFVAEDLSALSILCVIMKNSGTDPTGSITTNNAIVDLIRSCIKELEIPNIPASTKTTGAQ